MPIALGAFLDSEAAKPGGGRQSPHLVDLAELDAAAIAPSAFLDNEAAKLAAAAGDRHTRSTRKAQRSMPAAATLG
jgi:hypothetical protein